MEDIMIDLPISPTLLRVVRVFRIGRILRLIKVDPPSEHHAAIGTNDKHFFLPRSFRPLKESENFYSL